MLVIAILLLSSVMLLEFEKFGQHVTKKNVDTLGSLVMAHYDFKTATNGPLFLLLFS
ncbi:MAG: hypothetical protein LVO36_00240 [Nitrosopumilus sp. (ex Thoosa mismalolli)]|nr:hypothetical protein [Nitrosopumilus sp. (ex Thoosa mismalolli)]